MIDCESREIILDVDLRLKWTEMKLDSRRRARNQLRFDKLPEIKQWQWERLKRY